MKTEILDCMKKLLTLILLLMASVEMYAQSNVTTFLGIPVDGTKSSMIQKLEKKGFVYNQEEDLLEGEFNGQDVFIGIQTQKGKVWGITVGYNMSLDAINIKMTYENLCNQFRDNSRYMVLSEDPLPESKDLKHEMIVNKKRYSTIYIQNPQYNETDRTRMVIVSLSPVEIKGYTTGYYSVTITYINVLNMANGEDL